MNIDQLVAKATTLYEDTSSTKWEDVRELWSQVKQQYPHLLFRSIGDTTGPGWWKALDRALAEINATMERHPEYVFNVAQIKEKFGDLRFYWDLYLRDENGEVDEALETELRGHLTAVIDRVERECSRLCEVCGDPGSSRDLLWIKTLCDRHYSERKG